MTTSYPEVYKVDTKGKVRVYSMERSGDTYWMITGIIDGKKTQSKPTTAKPKNFGRANATTSTQQAELEIVSKYTKKQNEGYFPSVELAKANIGGLFFLPMLATEIDKVKPEKRPLPYMLDPKLDGMRMTSNKKEQVSRKGKPLPTAIHIWDALELFREKFPTITLDGELYNHAYKDNFEALMSLARKQKPSSGQLIEASQLLEYHVYDLQDSANPTMSAKDRKDMLKEIVEALDIPMLKYVPYTMVYTWDEYDEVVARHIEEGYEGSIARLPDSVYENKRTRTLLKIKEFITEEFPITSIIPGKGNKSDIAGTVFVDIGLDDPCGCGIKGSWEYCAELLKNRDDLIGEDATVRFFGKTAYGSLRFPVCIDVKRPD